jgi:autotransporter-associated beta strand protein/T5SS/PEP-CTERM-associated repeat protein
MKKSPLAAILAASSLISAHAADVTWTLNGTGAFTNGANWSDLAVPDTSDDAYISNGGTATIGSSDTVAVSRLLLENGTITQNGGSVSTVPFGTFESPGAYVIGSGAGQTGTYDASGASFLSGGRVRIGVDGGTGSVTLGGTSGYFGGFQQDTWVGAAGSTGSLTLNDSATWNIDSDWITVGNSGQGTLTMNDDSVMTVAGGNVVLGAGATGVSQTTLSDQASIVATTGEVWIGNDSATSTVDLSGTSSIVAQGNWIAIGRFGNGASNGTVTIRENASLQKTGGGGQLVIGPDGHGTVNVQGSGTLSSNNDIWMGEQDDGDGTLNVSGGTVSAGNDIIAGNGAGAVGAVNISGGSVSSNRDFVAGQGNGSQGTVVATGGTINVSGWTKLGFNTGAVGTMTVSGPTTVNTNGTFVMGDSGTGTLTMQGGTMNTTGQTWIGQGGDATGVFNLEGGDYTSGAWIAVGRAEAKGTLNVSGGTLTHTGTGTVVGAGLDGSNIVILGNASKVATVNHTGGTINNLNAVTVVGENAVAVAEWNATGGTANLGDTRVGFSGVGTMTINGTANYSSTSVYLGSNGGSTGTMNFKGGTFAANFIEEGAGNGFITFDGGIVKALQDVANYFRDFEAGDVTIGANGLKFDTNGKTVGIEDALEGTGGLTKLGTGTLTLSGANTYEGNTVVSAGTLSSTTASFGDFSSINILSGAILDLNFVGSDVIAGLYFNGVLQAAGVWGGIGSGAQFESDLITGSGTITSQAAIPEPSTVALVIGGIALVGLRMRSRARARQA